MLDYDHPAHIQQRKDNLDLLRAILQEATGGLQRKLARRRNTFRVTFPVLVRHTTYQGERVNLVLQAKLQAESVLVSINPISDRDERWESYSGNLPTCVRQFELCNPDCTEQLHAYFVQLLRKEIDRQRGIVIEAIQELRDQLADRKHYLAQIMQPDDIELSAEPARARGPAHSGD